MKSTVNGHLSSDCGRITTTCKMKTLVPLISFVLVLAYFVSAHGHMTEILVEDDMTDGGKTNSVEQVPPEDSVNGVCHVEFQVMKRVVGRCMKLGRSSRGCVAGTYLHPFHPECM